MIKAPLSYTAVVVLILMQSKRSKLTFNLMWNGIETQLRETGNFVDCLHPVTTDKGCNEPSIVCWTLT